MVDAERVGYNAFSNRYILNLLMAYEEDFRTTWFPFGSFFTAILIQCFS